MEEWQSGMVAIFFVVKNELISSYLKIRIMQHLQRIS